MKTLELYVFVLHFFKKTLNYVLVSMLYFLIVYFPIIKWISVETMKERKDMQVQNKIGIYSQISFKWLIVVQSI